MPRSTWPLAVAVLAASGCFALAGCGGCDCAGEDFRALCVERQRGLRTALLIYAADHDDVLPLAPVWQTATGPYVGINQANYICPKIEPLGGANFDIAFNSNLNGVALLTISAPETYAIVFDSTILSANAQSTTSTLPITPRHGTNVVMRLDGIATSVPPPNRGLFLP